MIGYVLSPLSWWNDLIINFPLSYAVALPFGLISRGLFIPAFIAAYWMWNVVGVLLMHMGVRNWRGEEAKSLRSELHQTLIWSIVYTVLILVLIHFEILSFPDELVAQFRD